MPSPCGPNSQCRESNDSPVCSCLSGMKGFAPNCRPECTGNSECPNYFSCINQRCQDPCPGSCGENAECKILNHNVVCTCFYGYEGDPTYGCSLTPITSKTKNSF